LRNQGFVFEIFADALLKNVCVKSVGGDKSKGWDEGGGSCGVVLRKGNLTIKECDLLSEQGSALAVDDDSKTAALRRLALEKCKIGPCGRHGVVLNRCAGKINMKDVEITSVEQTCVVLNAGDAHLSDCVMKGSKDSMHSCALEIFTWAEKAKDSQFIAVTLHHCFISDFNQVLYVLTSGLGKTEGKLTLTGCTIEKCNVAMTAHGSQAKIFFDKTNTVKDCAKETQVVNGGQIVSGEVAAAPVPAPAVEDPAAAGAEIKPATSTESAKSSVQVPRVSAETTNFARYCRLLMDVGRDQ
jgi:hypothetical protein